MQTTAILPLLQSILLSLLILTVLTSATPTPIAEANPAAATPSTTCDTVMWAAGGSDGKWDINYPVLASGPSTPWCTMDDGATGEGVASVQRSLNRCYNRGLTVDARYGPKTKAAVKYMQSILGVTQDGVWGSKTGSKMNWSASKQDSNGNVAFVCVLKKA